MYYSLINTKHFQLNDEKSSDYYVVKLCLNPIKSQLAANFSNEIIEVVDSKTLQTITSIKDLESMNQSMKYSRQNENHLIISTSDAINVYDLRHSATKVSKQFKIRFSPETDLNSDQLDLNHIMCFDFNCDFQYLVAGTELCDDKNVYLFFWDIRKPAAVLGSYYESHTDDMTDISFHPNRRNLLATGSCDQLINIFDMNKSEEDEALLTTLNIESAVEKIHWTKSLGNDLICLTQEEGVQLWSYDEVEPRVNLSAHSSDSKFDYVIDVLARDDLVCVGDKSGSVKIFDIKNYEPTNEIEFKEHLTKGHHRMVRTVCSAPDDSNIYSGGEDGLICVWNNIFESTDSLVHKSQSKCKTKMKRIDSKNRLNPY